MNLQTERIGKLCKQLKRVAARLCRRGAKRGPDEASFADFLEGLSSVPRRGAAGRFRRWQDPRGECTGTQSHRGLHQDRFITAADLILQLQAAHR
jgi:hypothetical protein